MSEMYIPNNLLSGWDVVVIDDEEDSLLVAQIILEEYGATIHPASDGAEGLEQVRSVKPRFVISDISMPGMDGWGFIAELKADAEINMIPVIALTAHAMIGDRERAISAGFQNYLTKPLSADTFMLNLLNLLLEIPVLAEDLRI